MVVDSFDFGGNNWRGGTTGKRPLLPSDEYEHGCLCLQDCSALHHAALRNTASGTLSIVIDDL